MAYSIGVLTFFVIIVFIGSLAAKKIANVEDYYVYGRNAPTVLIVGSLIASYLSTVAFMGEAGFSYDGYPIIMLIVFIFTSSGYFIGSFLFGRYLRRSKALTLPEYFGKRFQSNKVRRAAAITTIIGISAYLVAVTQGLAILLSSILNVSYPVALLIVWFVYTSFTFLSGAKGVVITDTIMFFIFTTGAFIGIIFIMLAAGGWPDAIVNTTQITSKPDLFSWHGITGENATMGTPFEALTWAIILGLVWLTVISVSPWQSSRYLMAKNEHVVVRSGMISMLISLFFGLLLHLGVSTVNTIDASITPSENVFIWSAINIMPVGIGVFILSGILSAGISSCSTFLQLIGSSVANDLFNLQKSQTQSNEYLIKLSRISMIGVSIIVLFITLWQSPSILWIGYFAATLFAASWGPTAFASIYWKNVSKEGAFWSIIVGFSGVVFGEVLKLLGVALPVYLDPAIIGAILGSTMLIIGSKLTAPTKEELMFRNKLLVKPKNLNDPKELKVTRRYPTIMFVGGIVLVLITFVFYYWPVTQIAQ